MPTAPFEAFLALLRAQADLVRKADAKIGMHHGLSASELLLLHAVDAAPERRARPSELAEALHLSASGVTRALLPLEKRKIVQRDPDPADGRASLVRLTGPGKALLDDALATADETAARLFRRLSLGQTRQLIRLLEEIG